MPAADRSAPGWWSAGRALCRACGGAFTPSRLIEGVTIACDAEACQLWAESYREALRFGSELPPEYGMRQPEVAPVSTIAPAKATRSKTRRDRARDTNRAFRQEAKRVTAQATANQRKQIALEQAHSRFRGEEQIVAEKFL